MTTDLTTTPAPTPVHRSWLVRVWRRAAGPASGGGLRGSMRRVLALTAALAPLALIAGWEIGSLTAGSGWAIPGVL